MAESPRESGSFFDELKRRKVVRLAIVYAAVAFAAIEAADVIVPRLNVPDWTVTVLIVLALLGFPIALALAWAFDITPRGLRKTGVLTTGEVVVARRTAWLSPASFMTVVVALAVGGAAGWVLKERDRDAASAAGAEDRPSVAVLAFVNMSSDPEQEYFSDGMTEEILNALAKIPELRVAARTSAFAYKGASTDLRQVGRELGVDALLEGSVRKEGEALRITAQLINVDDGFHLWSETYNRSLKDVFAVQEEIAGSIADALRVPLGLAAGQTLVPHRTEDLEAYEMYLQARSLYKRRGAAVERAILLFSQVIERDSSFAPAWAGLAEAYAVLPFYALIERPGAVERSIAGRSGADSATWENALTEAEIAAVTALELDPSIAEAHIALGNVRRDRWEWEAAEEHYRRALTLDPDYADGLEDLAELLSSVGRLDEALVEVRRAKDLDPLTPVFINAYGATLKQNGLYAEAIEQLERAIAIAPDVWFYYYELTLAYVGLGRFSDAEETVRRSTAALGGEDPEVLIAMIRGIADPALRESAIATVSSYPHPELRMLLGDREGALRDLERYVFDPPYGPKWIIWDVLLEPLRDDPRFAELVRRVGLTP